jgi:hypothetical protein
MRKQTSSLGEDQRRSPTIMTRVVTRVLFLVLVFIESSVVAFQASPFSDGVHRSSPLVIRLSLWPAATSSKGQPKQKRAKEDELIAAIQEQGSRLDNSERIASLVEELEGMDSVKEPAVAPEVYGRWRLLHTSNADTSSPIQRKAVDAQAFPIYQNIQVNDKNQLIVSQIVKFSDTAQLCVDALASTADYPLPELTERKGTGKILGVFNVLGVSLVGEEAKPDPNRPNSRIDFVFDEGNFDFNGFRIPYPVPFRLPLLRDAVKGWIDITYLSDRLRIARGNKGTTFVLVKEDEQKQQ